MSKLRIGVFMGGRSVENEASFNSGRTICDHLDTSRYEVVPLFQRKDGKLFILPWRFLHRGKITDFEHRLESEAHKVGWDDLKNIIDFIYLAIHGRYAEDGCLQGFLDVLNIPYLGSGILASALCMEKDVQKHMLKAHGFEVPKGVVVTPEELQSRPIASILEQLKAISLPLPYVVKPHREGSSLGVTIVNDIAALADALCTASTIQPDKAQAVLIEEYVCGMEFSCIILFDPTTGAPIPLPPTEIVPEEGSAFFNYDQKYMPGRSTKFTPARCNREQQELIQQTCIKVTELFAIKTISRIDGFLTPDNRVIIIDPNTLSGMGPTSFLFRQAAEIQLTHTTLITHLIETELHARGMVTTI